MSRHSDAVSSGAPARKRPWCSFYACLRAGPGGRVQVLVTVAGAGSPRLKNADRLDLPRRLPPHGLRNRPIAHVSPCPTHRTPARRSACGHPAFRRWRSPARHPIPARRPRKRHPPHAGPARRNLRIRRPVARHPPLRGRVVLPRQRRLEKRLFLPTGWRLQACLRRRHDRARHDDHAVHHAPAPDSPGGAAASHRPGRATGEAPRPAAGEKRTPLRARAHAALVAPKGPRHRVRGRPHPAGTRGPRFSFQRSLPTFLGLVGCPGAAGRAARSLAIHRPFRRTGRTRPASAHAPAHRYRTGQPAPGRARTPTTHRPLGRSFRPRSAGNVNGAAHTQPAARPAPAPRRAQIDLGVSRRRHRALAGRQRPADPRLVYRARGQPRRRRPGHARAPAGSPVGPHPPAILEQHRAPDAPPERAPHPRLVALAALASGAEPPVGRCPGRTLSGSPRAAVLARPSVARPARRNRLHARARRRHPRAA